MGRGLGTGGEERGGEGSWGRGRGSAGRQADGAGGAGWTRAPPGRARAAGPLGPASAPTRGDVCGASYRACNAARRLSFVLFL